MIEDLTLELEAQATAAAKAARATHFDARHPLTYWRASGHQVETATYDNGPLVWQPSHRERIPEWCGMIK